MIIYHINQIKNHVISRIQFKINLNFQIKQLIMLFNKINFQNWKTLGKNISQRWPHKYKPMELVGKSNYK